MAHLFLKQADSYAKTRPTYPPELFEFIASKTQNHDLVWDVGTGSGQAIPPLAEIFKSVVGTDTSQKQLDYAPKLPNVKYYKTQPTIPFDDIQNVASQSTVDLVTIAQAIHWFDLPKFYERVKYVLKKPNGVIAAWCYTYSNVDDKFDQVFDSFIRQDLAPYWDKAVKTIDNKFSDLYFPFEPVNGCDYTGPFEFKSEKLMSLDNFITYVRSWSSYNYAKEKGVDLLTDEVLQKFKDAWNNGDDDGCQKIVTFPIYLRIGKVGKSNFKDC